MHFSPGWFCACMIYLTCAWSCLQSLFPPFVELACVWLHISMRACFLYSIDSTYMPERVSTGLINGWYAPQMCPQINRLNFIKSRKSSCCQNTPSFPQITGKKSLPTPRDTPIPTLHSRPALAAARTHLPDVTALVLVYALKISWLWPPMRSVKIYKQLCCVVLCVVLGCVMWVWDGDGVRWEGWGEVGWGWWVSGWVGVSVDVGVGMGVHVRVRMCMFALGHTSVSINNQHITFHRINPPNT